MKKLILILLLISQESLAYYSVLDNGTVIEPKSFRLMFAPQFIMSGDKGMNVSGRFDYGWNDETSVRAVLGTGTTSFFAMGGFKWIPIPDVKGQPAIGAIGNVLFATANSESVFGLQIQPLISKTMDSGWGRFTPYASIPIGFQSNEYENIYPIQLVLGTEFKPDGFKYISFFTELGFDLSDAFSFLSFAAAITFDEENGLQFE